MAGFGRLRPSLVAGAGLLSIPRQAQASAGLRPPSSAEYVRSPPWYVPSPVCSYPAVSRTAWCCRPCVVLCAARHDLRRSTAMKLVLGSERGRRGWSSSWRHASSHARPLTHRLVHHLAEDVQQYWCNAAVAGDMPLGWFMCHHHSAALDLCLSTHRRIYSATQIQKFQLARAGSPLVVDHKEWSKKCY